MSQYEVDFSKLIRVYAEQDVYTWINGNVRSELLSNLDGTRYEESVDVIKEFRERYPDSDFSRWSSRTSNYAIISEKSRSTFAETNSYYGEMRLHKKLSEEGFLERLQTSYDAAVEEYKEKGLSPWDLYRRLDPSIGAYKDQYDLVMKMRDICLEYKRTASLTHVPRAKVEISQEDLYAYANRFPNTDFRVKNGAGAYMVSLGAHSAGVMVSGENGRILRPNTVFHEFGHVVYQNVILPRNTEIGKLGLAHSQGLHETVALYNEVVQNPWTDVVRHDVGDLIRVSANKVDYILHLALRVEIEHMIFTGQIKWAEVPRIWNELSETYFNKTPENSWEGWLQDIHWAYGLFGYWTSYAVGILKAIELYEDSKDQIKIETVDERYQTTDQVVIPIAEMTVGGIKENQDEILKKIFPDLDKSLGLFTDYIFENFQLV